MGDEHSDRLLASSSTFCSFPSCQQSWRRPFCVPLTPAPLFSVPWAARGVWSVSKPSGALEAVTTPLPSLPRDIFGVEMLHLEVLFIQKRQRYSCGSAASAAQTLTAYLLTESSVKASAKRVWTPSDVDDFLIYLEEPAAASVARRGRRHERRGARSCSLMF